MVIPPEAYELLQSISSLGSCLFGLLGVYSLAAACTFWLPRRLMIRWLVVLYAASLPLFFYTPGVWSVFLTGEAIIFSVRVSSLAEQQKRHRWSRLSLFFWLLNPVYRAPTPEKETLKQRFLSLAPSARGASIGLCAWVSDICAVKFNGFTNNLMSSFHNS